MKTKTIGVDPDKVFGLQATVDERLHAAYRKQNPVFILHLEAFLKMSEKKRNELLGIKSFAIEEIKHQKLNNSNVVVSALFKMNDEFNPDQHFKKGDVKYWLSDNFQKYVLNPAKPFSAISGMSFSKHSLKETTYDKDIMEELGINEQSGKLMTREEILHTIADLTGKQPKGESGTLLTNGYATIIGYMKCDDGVVRAVDVCWYSAHRGWYCYCRDLDSWDAGFGVLSRN